MAEIDRRDSASRKVDGGCLCGAIRYQFDLPITDAAYCHCRMCQRSLGSPVSAWLSVSVQQFRWIQGKPKVYYSSRNGQRQFCGECGTQLLFLDTHHRNAMDINIGTLDCPDAFPPGYHIWTDSQVHWLIIDDNLPRYTDAGPDG